MGGGGVGGSGVEEVRGGCVWRSEPFCENSKIKIFFWGVGAWVRGVWLGGGGGVRVDGNREVKLV